MLKLNLLGSPQIYWHNEPVLKLTSAKSQALLYYLALSRRAHSRLALSGLLWPDKSEDEARTNLRQSIRLARKLMPDLYDAQRETVQLNPELTVELDARVFERTVSTYLKDGAQIETGLPTLLAAADLYQGQLLASFFVEDAGPFEDWVRLERERLHQMALDLFGRLASYYAGRKEIGVGLLYGDRLLGLDRLREESYRLLMQLHAWDGNYGAALQRYNGCVEMLEAEFDLGPSPETVALYERVLHLREKPANPLPVPTLPLVDRIDERAELHLLVSRPETQMITLLGQGGIGKTRLALAVAEGEKSRFLDGVYWIDLAEAENAEDIAYEIADMVECRFSGSGSPEKQLRRYLRNKEMLLVLDNFEQLMRDKSAVRLVTQIMQASAALKMLITSRIRLGLVQEQTYLLDHLPLPAEQAAASAKVGEHDAVALFTHCARQVRPGWSGEEEIEAVHRICHLVEGLPLGLQMAASLIEYRSCRDVAAALEQNISDLEIEALDLPERHQSLRAAFDYSYDLLDEELQQLLAQLSIFHGRFTAEAVAEIVGGTVAELGRLVSRSLIRFEPPARYSLHTVVRQLAAERLTDADREGLQASFNRFYLTFLADLQARLTSLDAKAASAAISADYENIRHAWLRAVDREDADLLLAAAQSLESYLGLRGMYYEGERLFDASDLEVKKLTATLVVHQAHFLVRINKYDELIEKITKALDDEPDNPWVQAKGGAYWAEVLWRTGKYAEAEKLSRSGLLIAESGKIPDALAHNYFNLGVSQDLQKRFDLAIEYLEKALNQWEEASNPRKVATALNSLGVVYSRKNENLEAIDCLEKGLQICVQTGDEDTQLSILNNLGFLEIERNRYEKAIEYLNLLIDISAKNGNLFNEGTGYYNLSRAQFDLGQVELSKNKLLKALEIFRSINENTWIAKTLIYLGRVEGFLGNFEDADRNFDFAGEMISQTKNDSDACELMIFRSQLENKKGNVEQQIIYAENAAALAEGLKNIRLIERARSLLEN